MSMGLAREKYPLPAKREKVYRRLEQAVGESQLHEITRIEIPNGNRIFVKREDTYPSGSGFDPVYLHLFRVAEHRGFIEPGVTPVVESSTGNAGIAFAYYAPKLGFHEPQPPTVVIHEDAPKVRIDEIKRLGAQVVFSPSGQYTRGYVQKLEEVLAEDKAKKGGKLGENKQRLYAITKIIPEAREPYHDLADEIVRQARQQGADKIHYFVGIVGSGTSMSGIGEQLITHNQNVKLVAADPVETQTTKALVETGEPLQFETMPHQVWGASTFGLPLGKLNINVEPGFLKHLSTETFTAADWKRCMRLLEEKEGLPLGRSSGGALAVALKLAKKVKNKTILILGYDSKGRYDPEDSRIK